MNLRPLSSTISLLLASLLAIGCGPSTADDVSDAGTRDMRTGVDSGLDAGTEAGVDAGFDAGWMLPERPWDITERGPWEIGYAETEITYQAIGVDAPRTIRLVFWYPTRQTSGSVTYYRRVLPRAGIWKDATPAEPVDEEGFPLLVFSHGSGAMAEQSFFFTEHFASHGWIVVAPEHTGNTISDPGSAEDTTTALLRPQDITAALDFVLDVSEPPGEGADPIEARLIDESRVVMSGHSFGAFTTLASAGASFRIDDLELACDANPSLFFCDLFNLPEAVEAARDGFFDDRISLAIPQSPGGDVAFGAGMADLRVPTLMFTASMDMILPNSEEGDPLWSNMERDAGHIRIDVQRAGHFTFSDLCLLFSGSTGRFAEDGCGDDFIDPALAHQIVNHYSMAFARRHLFGDDRFDALLTGDQTPYEPIVLQR